MVYFRGVQRQSSDTSYPRGESSVVHMKTIQRLLLDSVFLIHTWDCSMNDYRRSGYQQLIPTLSLHYPQTNPHFHNILYLLWIYPRIYRGESSVNPQNVIQVPKDCLWIVFLLYIGLPYVSIAYFVFPTPRRRCTPPKIHRGESSVITTTLILRMHLDMKFYPRVPIGQKEQSKVACNSP